MKNKLSWGIALLPFVPSVWMQGQEQKQGIGNRRPNIIFIMSDDHAGAGGVCGAGLGADRAGAVARLRWSGSQNSQIQNDVVGK